MTAVQQSHLERIRQSIGDEANILMYLSDRLLDGGGDDAYAMGLILHRAVDSLNRLATDIETVARMTP